MQEDLPIPPCIPVNLENLPVMDRLKACLHSWKRIHPPRRVLNIIQEGFRLDFIKKPSLTSIPLFNSSYKDPTKQAALLEEVDILLKKGVIEEITDSSLGFFSRLFLVPKKENKWRPIIDLSTLNLHLRKKIFKMETISTVLSSLVKGEWMTSIDLTDAYFHIAIFRPHRRYLRFMIGTQIYQFCALPFGLTHSPEAFTAVLRPVVAWCHLNNFFVHQYIDDWLIRAPSSERVVKATEWILTWLQGLGFKVNLDKSDLVPGQIKIFLGVTINLVDFSVLPSRMRLDNLQSHLRDLLRGNPSTAHKWQVVLGHLTSCQDLIPLGTVKARPFRRCLALQWNQDVDSPYLRVHLTSESALALEWWLDPLLSRSARSLTAFNAKMEMFTDASDSGWGAHMNQKTACGVWNVLEMSAHINLKEMWAVRLGFLALCKNLADTDLMVVSDNTTVVAYLNRGGGMMSCSTSLVAEEILCICHQQKIRLRARYLAGVLNLGADMLSRTADPVQSEWTLSPAVVNFLWDRYGKPEIDLFATCLNNRLPRYMPLVQTRKL